MDRALRTFSFSGYLIGDLAPVMQNLLDVAIETQGPGLLIHPTIGALQVGLVSSSTAVHRDKMCVIEVEFVEEGDSLFPPAIVTTVVSVLAAADSALTATNNDLASSAAPAAVVGPAVTGEGANVVGAFAAQTATGGANPTAIVGTAVARYRHPIPTLRTAGMPRSV
jgi:prophage DNA circulation protein